MRRWLLSPSQGNNSFSISDNGWIKLDNGLIIQWGYIKNEIPNIIQSGHAKTSIVHVNFPISFPHKVFNVTTTINSSGLGLDRNTDIIINGTLTNSGVNIGADELGVYWMAIGY